MTASLYMIRPLTLYRVAQKSLNVISVLFSTECRVTFAPQCIFRCTDSTVKQIAKKAAYLSYHRTVFLDTYFECYIPISKIL